MSSLAAYTAVRFSSRAVRPNLSAQRMLAPSRRTFSTTRRRQDDIERSSTSASSSSASSSSSSSSSSPKRGLSIINIALATAAIIIGTPYALDLYSTLSGTSSPRSSSSASGKLEPSRHHPLPLRSSAFYPDPSTPSNHKLLQIALPTSPASHSSTELKARLRIRSVYIKEPSLVIERAYTPLYDTMPGSNAASLGGRGEVIDLIVKRYDDGELGRYLHRAQPGAELEVRGPADTWSFTRDSNAAGGAVPERIVLLVGGTGVTPAFQLLTNLFGRPYQPKGGKGEGVPKVDLLYATQDLGQALLLPELQALAEANGDKVKVKIFAERLPSSLTANDQAALGQLVPSSTNSGRSWLPFSRSSALDPKLELTTSTGATKIPVFEGRITKPHLEKTLTPSTNRTLVLISGPDGMVDSLAGPKSRNGQSQGPLRGTLASLGLKQEDVFKL